jgi:uncharacterized damage-inducible protein DinB
MTRIALLKKELEKETAVTIKMLSIIPGDKYDWKPHPKSMSIQQLANHIAELPAWLPMTLQTTELDFATSPYVPSTLRSSNELVNLFEKNAAGAMEQLTDEREVLLDDIWTLRQGEQVLTAEPKYDILQMSIAQIIHHRAQLGVFLRLLDVPIPGSYGPSADEMEMA